VRDAKGNVVDVILPEDDNEGEAGKQGETVGEDSDGEEKEVAPVPAKTDVVKSQYPHLLCHLSQSPLEAYFDLSSVSLIALLIALEILSSTAAPVKRHTSTSEKEWLTQLVVKYGDDRAAMARDPKLNVWQKTSGEIGRM
jgi:nucleolar protein 16